jgi:hypothetical protein
MMDGQARGLYPRKDQKTFPRIHKAENLFEISKTKFFASFLHLLIVEGIVKAQIRIFANFLHLLIVKGIVKAQFRIRYIFDQET